MTEKDLDIAIEKCERIMEFDTRTLENPDSENGYIFEKVYDLLKFLRQFEFETGGMDDTISRQAAIDAVKDAVIKDEQQYAEDALKALPSAQAEQSSEIQDILDYLDTVLHPIISPEHWNVYSELHDMISTLPSAQPEIIRCKDCKYNVSSHKCL